MRGMTVTSFPSTVLVVDDEPAMLDVLGAALEMRALPFETTLDGEDAIARLRERGYGCLIVDQRLGEVNGLDVIAAAREPQPYCACIVITAYPSRQSVIEALRLGAIDYLEKPIKSLDLMLEQVENAIANQRNAYELERLRARYEQLQEVQDTAEQLRVALATTSRLATDLAGHAARLGDALAGASLPDETRVLHEQVRAAVEALETHTALLQYTVPEVLE